MAAERKALSAEQISLSVEARGGYRRAVEAMAGEA
jgi:hypothetical protein